MSFKQKRQVLIMITLPLCGLWFMGHGAYIHAKAILAQSLLETAWADTLDGQKEVKPWPWADTWPVCRLNVPILGIRRIVLAGASGSSLAFGPGHLFKPAGTPCISDNSIIAGHRDTHFKFLRDLKIGDVITIENKQHDTFRFAVIDHLIVYKDQTGYLQKSDMPTLTLVTCYPFDSLVTGGPLRYLVIAKIVKKLMEV